VRGTRIAFTESARVFEASESLHLFDGLLNALFGLQLPCAGVRRGQVPVPAQPVLRYITLNVHLT